MILSMTMADGVEPIRAHYSTHDAENTVAARRCVGFTPRKKRGMKASTVR